MSFEQTSRPHLVVQHTGQMFPLSARTVTLGTAEDNNIILADPAVSAHHARLSWDPLSGAYFVEDLGSVEGTYINKRPISGLYRLRDGDEIRLGNTILEVKLGAALGLAPEARQEGRRNTWVAGLIIGLLAVATVLCVALFSVFFWAGREREPNVVIQSPADGERIPAGSQVTLRVTASGASDITLLEVSMDGILVGTLSSEGSEGTSLLTISKPWTFGSPGEHEISAEAFTAGGRVGAAERARITVLPSGEGTPTPEGTATPSATPTETTTPEPTTTATPELPTSTPLPPPPQIEYFQASPAAITAGDCTTLQWGQISFSTVVLIEPGLGEVAVPGSREVCPGETTSYMLTAIGPGGTTTASTTVIVVGNLADLTVDSISFEPSPPVQGQQALVRIAIRNAAQGAARPFDWTWQAGSEAFFDGRVNGLIPGETTVVSIAWTPQGAYDSLATEAQVDTGNEVAESNETNNQLAATIQVVQAPAGPETVVLKSQASLDGYRLSNGGGSASDEIQVGNGGFDGGTELVARGFLSFDLSSIPAGATIDSVRLEFYQQRVQGEPYQTLGNLVLDHVDYGSSLEASAYDTPALHSAVLAQMTMPNSWYILADPTITLWVEENLAMGRTRLQLRLRFAQETDGDADRDLAFIEPGEGPQGHPPQITVVYRP